MRTKVRAGEIVYHWPRCGIHGPCRLHVRSRRKRCEFVVQWEKIAKRYLTQSYTDMIIVLFHVFYLLGQYIYKNYRVKRLRSLCDAAKESEKSSFSQQTYEMFSDNSYDDDEKSLASNCHEAEQMKFKPPAYIQRYNAVQNILNDPVYSGKIRKVLIHYHIQIYSYRYEI